MFLATPVFALSLLLLIMINVLYLLYSSLSLLFLPLIKLSLGISYPYF